MNEERRTATRIEDRNLVCVTTPRGEMMMHELINLSLGGVRVRANGSAPEAGSELALDLELDQARVEVKGRVVHTSEAEVGFVFVDLPAAEQALIEAFIDSR